MQPSRLPESAHCLSSPIRETFALSSEAYFPLVTPVLPEAIPVGRFRPNCVSSSRWPECADIVEKAVKYSF
jgi:hypothetical protein